MTPPRPIPNAEGPACTYVPDGDPCPKHGLPTRLYWMPYFGHYSQCQGCIEAFLDWFSSHTREARAAAIEARAAAKSPNRKIDDFAISTSPPAPAPQLDLGVTQ